MATDIAKTVKYCCMAAGAETTTGTAETTLDATNAQFVIIDPVMRFNAAFNKVPLPGGPGQRKGSAGARSATLTFKTELTGNGASGLPPWATVLLPACDYALTSTTFAATRGAVTLTMDYYEDGIMRRLYGARGDFNITAETGKPAMVEWTFTGKYATPADVAILSPTFPTVIAPIFAASTVTIGAFTPRMSRFSIGPRNEVVMREDQADATAFHAAAIVDRDPQGSFDPEATAIATKDWFTDFTAGTERALSIAIGGTTNNIITIAAAAIQTVDPNRGNRNKLLTDEIAFQCNGASPFTIAFS